MADPRPSGNYLLVTLNGTLYGQNAETQLLYWYLNASPMTPNASAATLVVLNDLWTAALQDMLHEAFTLNNITCRMGYILTPSTGVSQHTRVVEQQGSVTASQGLPPNVTVRILRTPDNSVVYSDDADAPEFSKGWYKIGFSGIPEGQQDGGLLDPTYDAGWNAVGEAMETLTVSGNDFNLVIGRAKDSLKDGDNAAAWCFVAETSVSSKLGTVNSRSRLS